MLREEGEHLETRQGGGGRENWEGNRLSAYFKNIEGVVGGGGASERFSGPGLRCAGSARPCNPAGGLPLRQAPRTRGQGGAWNPLRKEPARRAGPRSGSTADTAPARRGPWTVCLCRKSAQSSEGAGRGAPGLEPPAAGLPGVGASEGLGGMLVGARPTPGARGCGIGRAFPELALGGRGVRYLGASLLRAVLTGWGGGSPKLRERGLGAGTAPVGGGRVWGGVSRRA